MPEFFLSSFFGTYPIIGSFHLPTHSRDAHRNFFLMIPSKFNIEILAIRALLCPVDNTGLTLINSIIFFCEIRSSSKFNYITNCYYLNYLSILV